MKTQITVVLGALLAAKAAPLPADEGKWMPQQIPALAERLRALGFEGDPQAFADLTGQPMGAVVSLGNCTGSFVSPDGLIATNHHCVTGALQYNSTPQRNLLVDGYLAKARAEELSNGPGSKIWVTVSVKDVTDEIAGKLDPKLDDLALHDLIERRLKQRTSACETGGLRCKVASFFEGLSYYEIAQLEIPDVRLVYAPAEGIGNFGGEADNWRWPRHTGDWSFYRAYVGPAGTPAAYAEANVPYKPKQWLKVEPAGVKEGDLVFVTGYPGVTRRLATYAEVEEAVEWTFPRTIRTFQEQIDLLTALGKQDPTLEIKASARVQGLNNTLTNRKGMLEGLVGSGLLTLKQEREKQLVAWIAADAARQKEYGDVFPALAELHTDRLKTRERDALLTQLLGGSPLAAGASALLHAAHTALRLAAERPKPDAQRESGLQQRDFSRIREQQERAQRTLDPRLDRALLGYWMRHAAALPAEERISGLDKAAGLTPGMAKADSDAAIDAYLDRLVAGTKLTDPDVRLALFEKSKADIAATRDSFVDLALALDPLYQATQKAENRRYGRSTRVRPRYAKALLAEAGGLVAPDANSTLRVTYGQVKARPNAQDGIDYRAFTTLAGIERKHTGEGEFDAPDAQLAAIRALRAGKASRYLVPELGDVPVDFLSTVDITGGNSGSPTLNGRGEFVGLVFDGTFDTVASDYVYDPVRTRSIHADVRYLLWNMTEADGASHLVEEMGVR
ncbi:MAG: S46 family peptidase [Vicinamibacterales bacterium]